jgi:hypothetical protein
MYMHIYIYIDESIGLCYHCTIRGLSKVYKVIFVPIFLDNHKFAYIETGESELCLAKTR